MNTFISWHYTRPPSPPSPLPSKPTPSKKSPDETWEDAAFETRWPDAIWLFLLERMWDECRLWPSLNLIVHASFPRDRRQVRQATREALVALGELTRSRKVRRIRKHLLKPVVEAQPYVNMGELLNLPPPQV